MRPSVHSSMVAADAAAVLMIMAWHACGEDYFGTRARLHANPFAWRARAGSLRLRPMTWPLLSDSDQTIEYVYLLRGCKGGYVPYKLYELVTFAITPWIYLYESGHVFVRPNIPILCSMRMRGIRRLTASAYA